MAQIKRISDGELISCVEYPTYSHEMHCWMCGYGLYIYDEDGTLFEPVGPAPLPMLTPMTFYLAFTPQERIAIKSSTDPMVKEFWDTYDLAARLNVSIDPNLISVQGGIVYLATPEIGILKSSDRIEQILSGVAQ